MLSREVTSIFASLLSWGQLLMETWYIVYGSFSFISLQDYHWWWRSFLTSGFTAVYFFFYIIHYYVSKLELEGGMSTFLYFGYMLIVVFLFFLLTGKLTSLFFLQNRNEVLLHCAKISRTCFG